MKPGDFIKFQGLTQKNALFANGKIGLLLTFTDTGVHQATIPNESEKIRPENGILVLSVTTAQICLATHEDFSGFSVKLTEANRLLFNPDNAWIFTQSMHWFVNTMGFWAHIGKIQQRARLVDCDLDFLYRCDFLELYISFLIKRNDFFSELHIKEFIKVTSYNFYKNDQLQ